ncbi:hypothetical protein AGABI2DRAFT_184217 [Agaricus bisporus var. bisporus H97]|uniref:hypothetical protein n=1 Tax=Agaricus bisporus var. bisporus (strain H97 / ATCC MYA-4626 / FGSC 10389) TaxID=936046 RepID=UPI00029F79FD|nr:hypothetical protein AGABI2DRAFT_184217 [Agaricus bisporus var. bisporus H97]EKV49517.1 hypothetical protein AGABI2DRAFT_184217 [Agaricus bisporus var. bisporus H97]
MPSDPLSSHYFLTRLTETGTSLQKNLSWHNVLIAFAFISFNALVSWVLEIGIGKSLLISAVRCMVQLTLVATILQQVFMAENKWIVAGIAILLNVLGTMEVVVNKVKCRYEYMLPSVLIAMLGSTIPISIIGTRYAMAVDPFWEPMQYIPIVGMLCGATISGITVSTNYILKEFQENRDKVEIYLAFGASRIEACRPIAIAALRLALTPTINSMSVLGIIAIPGMMTGAILGGSSVQQAARLQMIIIFMISSSTTLATVFTTFSCIAVIVDAKHRIRCDRIIDNSSKEVRVVLGREKKEEEERV